MHLTSSEIRAHGLSRRKRRWVPVERIVRRCDRRVSSSLGRFEVQHWKHIGTINRMTEVGRVTPSTLRSSAGLMSALGIGATEDGCAPSFAWKEIVVAAVGAQRTARPTFQFMERSTNASRRCGKRN